MWGNKKNKCNESEFFKGTNIFEKLSNSTFGKIKQIFSEIFSESDIKNYTLPKVIVIGNESSGKSSLLENITKCQIFPRNQKLCTKCPIHFRLTKGACKYAISFFKNEDKLYETIQLTDKNEMYGVIDSYMKKFPDDYVSDNEITVDITDEDVPTFEFYDLPGIRTYPPESAKITTDLYKKYLADKNSIILCVVPAVTPRLTSCQSIALISEMKMEENCILTLTMSDKLQPDDIEELLIKRIIKISDELNGLKFAGCVAVVNRLHSGIYSLEENDGNEIKWFNENILDYIPDEYVKYATQIKDNIMISNLLSKMDNLYNEFIHKDWKPKMLKMIERKINDLKEKYKNMGDLNIDPIVLNNVLYTFIDNIYDDIRTSCDEPVVSMSELFEKENDEENDEENDASCDEVDQYFDIKQSEIIYHDKSKIINAVMHSYSLFDMSCIKDMIEYKFKNEKEHNVERFVDVKNDLIERMEKHFDELTKNKLAIIKESIEKYSIMKYLDDNVSIKYHNKIFELYRLKVLYPLFNIEINYSVDDYVESKEYKQRRNMLLESIVILERHYDSINNLFML